MESDPRKQKRLGPAPIASFEKSFEDTTSSPAMQPASGPPPPVIPATLVTASSEDRQEMDSGGDPINTGTAYEKCSTISSSLSSSSSSSLSTAITATINQSTSSTTAAVQVPPPSTSSATASPSTSTTSTPSRRATAQQHEFGKRPPHLQSINVSVQISTASDVQSGNATLGVQTPTTPRIDISRASSSSHHEDSRDSSPENVFEQVGTGTLQEAIGLGFREEGALDLRSSTEELYFMDPVQKKEEQEKLQQARKSPIVFKFDEHQSYLQQHQRKDSASSEVAALLCISGRTSRISSVGSQGSAVSRLSAVSGVSRSPSPHRMILETSFCGPKPLENVVDGSIGSSVEPPTAEVLEQVLLSRKHDPTQAVFAEGIKIESSPKKQLTNGEAKRKTSSNRGEQDAKENKASTGLSVGVNAGKIGVQRKTLSGGVAPKTSTGKPIVGVTPSGTEYIRIKLKPDHLYDDKGLAPNERVVDRPHTSSEGHKKPVSLSIGKDISNVEQRLTPSSSPKPARHMALTRGDIAGSRSPSPGNIAVSRKSSFCSLFKPKDSPDSPRDRSRSRSKSRDRSTPQSQAGTPNKQKSVLAIFKPKRSGSKSKCSSPIDQDAITSQLDGISQVEFKFKSDQPESKSRPSSRLRYYDTPSDGKTIHIPLHTPPDERDDRRFAPKEAEPPPTAPHLTPTSSQPSGPSSYLPNASKAIVEQTPPALPVKSPKPPQIEKIQRIENLDLIHSLASEGTDHDRTWSLEVQRHSSQDSQETISLDTSVPNSRKVSKPNLTDVIESPIKENGIVPTTIVQSTIIQQRQQSHLQQTPQSQQQQQTQQPQTHPVPTPAPPHHALTSREKRRLLFATRIGSGSEEQIFSTQFSLSKTESLSSQLSEQTSIPDSPAVDSRDSLHRSDTVIRRTDDSSAMSGTNHRKKDVSDESRQSSDEYKSPSGIVGSTTKKSDSSDDAKRKSKSTSEDEEKRPVIVMMRKKDSSDESRRKSKSASEEDDPTNRHSKYIENFDVTKKIFHETSKRQSSRNSSDSSIKERDSHTSSKEDQDYVNTPDKIPQLPTKPPKSIRDNHQLALSQQSTDRQSVISNDDLIESSESERDSEMDPNRIKRHLPRHIGAIEDHESTGLVSQDSFEEELPYVPTTLPEERALGISLIPMKERINMELKTCPVDRPRSTTPLNPACLEEYCGIVTPDDNDNVPTRGEKLRISLPRKDSTKDRTQKAKSPRRVSNASGKSWFEFAEQGIRGSCTPQTPTQPCAAGDRRGSNQDDEPPPPLPPRKPSGTISGGQWVNFENIPEKRKPPKRITALPKDSPQEPKPPLLPTVQYNYVKPEECQCECHEVNRESSTHSKSIASVDLLQQGEDMQPLLEPESQEGIDPSDSSVDYSYVAGSATIEQKPFEMDLSLGHTESNRSSLHSQDPESPDRTHGIHDSTMSKSRKKSPDHRDP